VRVALPLTSGADPRDVAVPSPKKTVPVGVRGDPSDAVTVAVRVSGWPARAGFADELSTVLVDAWTIRWLRTGEVLAAQFGSPW
jgi:hypothetical protein